MLKQIRFPRKRTGQLLARKLSTIPKIVNSLLKISAISRILITWYNALNHAVKPAIVPILRTSLPKKSARLRKQIKWNNHLLAKKFADFSLLAAPSPLNRWCLNPIFQFWIIDWYDSHHDFDPFCSLIDSLALYFYTCSQIPNKKYKNVSKSYVCHFLLTF